MVHPEPINDLEEDLALDQAHNLVGLLFAFLGKGFAHFLFFSFVGLHRQINQALGQVLPSQAVEIIGEDVVGHLKPGLEDGQKAV